MFSYLAYYATDAHDVLPLLHGRGPGLADYKGRLVDIPFDFHEMIGALAPRHVLIIAPTKDSNFRADSDHRVANKLFQGENYETLRRKVRSHHGSVGHRPDANQLKYFQLCVMRACILVSSSRAR